MLLKLHYSLYTYSICSSHLIFRSIIKPRNRTWDTREKRSEAPTSRQSNRAPELPKLIICKRFLYKQPIISRTEHSNSKVRSEISSDGNKMLLSSTNIIIRFETLSGRSFMLTRNRIDPRIDPWGTPSLDSKKEEQTGPSREYSQTNCVLTTDTI